MITATLPNRLLPLIALFLALAFYAVEQGAQPLNQVDDAYISYRYAANLLAGEGLVFNPGERVEGYTNLLWVLLVAGVGSLGVAPHMAGFYLAFVCGALALVASALYAGSLLRPQHRWLAGLAPLLLLGSSGFAHWSNSGLETPLVLLLCTLAFLAAHRQATWVVLACCVLAWLTRPDAVLLAVAVLAVPLLRECLRQRSLFPGWRHYAPSLLFAASVVGLTLWRLWYYGDIVPNTFHAKVGGLPPGLGLDYSRYFLADGALLLLPAALLAACLRAAQLYREIAFVALTVAYVLAVGGDAFPYSRFYLPLLPLLIGMALYGVALAWPRWRLLAGALLVAKLAALAMFTYGPPLAGFDKRLDWAAVSFPVPAKREGAMKRDPFYNGNPGWRMRRIDERTEDDALIAAVGIGALGYYLPNPILDTLGLIHPQISRSGSSRRDGRLAPGHQRSNAQYVFDREPRYIMVPPKGTPMLVTIPAVLDIWAHPDFDAHYEWDAALVGYRRVD